MNGISDIVTELLKEILKEWVLSNLEGLLTEVNESVGSVTGMVNHTPSSWNATVFALIDQLSRNVIMPIAGMIISFVLVYELISMAIDKNNLHEFNTGIFMRFVLKACIAVMILNRTFDIVMAVFDVGSYLVTQAGVVIIGETSVDFSGTLLTQFEALMEDASAGYLLRLGLDTCIVRFSLKVCALMISGILYGRMIQIYLWISVAPIPAATAVNQEWGSIGRNYLKGICAIALQGFFIMICVGIYSALISTLVASDDPLYTIHRIMLYALILAYTLYKSESVARAILS